MRQSRRCRRASRRTGRLDNRFAVVKPGDLAGVAAEEEEEP
jgi:hypothetical protein